jgi:ribose transport system ATP-binding protein
MSNDYQIEMIDIEKSFPGVKSLQKVNFQLLKGEIHGLVGENGAGKSTLMKILAGVYTHDAGIIKLFGEEQGKLTPSIVQNAGISFIHQERYVVPHLTVAESLFLGIEPSISPLKFINRKKMEKMAETIINENLGISIAGNRLIGTLTVAEQQLVQICRALMHQPKVIVFDEPTAVLAAKESQLLFKIIKDLKNRGISVIYISHYLGEILDLCDRITAIRNGKKVDTVACKGLTVEDIVFMMIGHKIQEQFPPKNRKIGETLLKVDKLTHSKMFRNISFELKKGEILGIVGLMGSGHDVLSSEIYHNKEIVSGMIHFDNKLLNKVNPNRAVKLGIGYIPEDRRGVGVIQRMSVQENITLADLARVSKNNIINKEKENLAVDELINKLAIRTPGREQLAGVLSGGNQQKVVIAKWLHSDAKLYILNQPTSGVDVGAKTEIYALIKNIAEQGAGVLMFSQDLQEVVGMCTRILVMFRGEIVCELDGNSTTVDQLMVYMTGGKKNGGNDSINAQEICC